MVILRCKVGYEDFGEINMMSFLYLMVCFILPNIVWQLLNKRSQKRLNS